MGGLPPTSNTSSLVINTGYRNWLSRVIVTNSRLHALTQCTWIAYNSTILSNKHVFPPITAQICRIVWTRSHRYKHVSDKYKHCALAQL